MNFVKRFGLFWWDFIVGDSIVLAIGVVAVLAAAFALVELSASGAVEVIVPLGVMVTVAASLPRRR